MNTDSAMGGLIKQGGNLETPREAKGSDWPNVGASGPAGESSGAGKLVTQTENQEGAGRNADSGWGTPSVWGKAGTEYKIGVSKGEGGMASTAVSIKGSVDCKTGQMSPPAQDQTY